MSRSSVHNDVIKWKHFPHYWPFVRVFHRWIPITKPVTRSFDIVFDLLPEQTVEQNNRNACDLRRHCAHYDVTVMYGHCCVIVLISVMFWRVTTYPINMPWRAITGPMLAGLWSVVQMESLQSIWEFVTSIQTKVKQTPRNPVVSLVTKRTNRVTFRVYSNLLSK